MQNLPVILAVFVAAAATIFVLFWRIKPQPAADTKPFEKRIDEELETIRLLRAKIDDAQGTLTKAEAVAATAQANFRAAEIRTIAAENKLKDTEVVCTSLQGKLNQIGPSLATAQAEKDAAVTAKADAVARHDVLMTRASTLQTDLNQALARAATVETDAKAFEKRAKEELETVRVLTVRLENAQTELTEVKSNAATAEANSLAAEARASVAERKFSDLEAAYASLQAKLNQINPSLATAQAERDAAEAARADTVARYDVLVIGNTALHNDLNTALAKAATTEANAGHLQQQVDGMILTIESLELSLTEERAERVKAVTKQQSDEAAASHFKVISQEILNGTLAEAKRGVEELAAAFQKSSGAELDKHAQKITQTLEPLQDRLLAYDAAVAGLKKDTNENYGSLRSQLDELQKTERSLHDQAKALTTALSSSPKVKGNYGEMILRQLVEFVGMQEKYHFEPQASRETEEGRKIPDLVVSLPGGQKVLVDAKAVMNACVEAHQAQDDAARLILLKEHCKNVRLRVMDLSSKNYFADHQDAVEAVVLFIPAESLYATAIENDAELTEFAMRRNIIVCGPNSLMMLLKVANQLWRRASVEQEAQKIKECGEDIYKAAHLYIEKYAKLGTKIQQLEEAYNDAAGTLNGNLIPKGRKMGAFTAVTSNKEIEDIAPLKQDIRPFTSPEAKRMLASATEKLPGLSLGEYETTELTFSAGDEQ